jgi:hypothetical protein
MAGKKKTRKKGHLFGKPSGEIIKHPGAVKEAAARHGISTEQEAKRESKSPDKHIAARGRLALRFEGKAKHGNFITKKGKKKSSGKKTKVKA